MLYYLKLLQQDVPLVTVLFLHIIALCFLLCTGHCFHPVIWQGEFSITKLTWFKTKPDKKKNSWTPWQVSMLNCTLSDWRNKVIPFHLLKRRNMTLICLYHITLCCLQDFAKWYETLLFQFQGVLTLVSILWMICNAQSKQQRFLSGQCFCC